MPVRGISVMGRNTQGVRLVNLAPAGEGELLPDAVAAVTRVVSEEEAGGPSADSDESMAGDQAGAPMPDDDERDAGAKPGA